MLVVQSCPTLCYLVDYSLPGSSVHEILQARILEWVASLFSRGSSPPRAGTRVSCIAGRFFTTAPPGKPSKDQVSFNFLISWLQSPSTVNMEPGKIKFVSVSTFSPYLCHEVLRPDDMILVFRMLSFKPAFHSPLSPSSRGFLGPLPFLPSKWYHLHV